MPQRSEGAPTNPTTGEGSARDGSANEGTAGERTRGDGLRHDHRRARRPASQERLLRSRERRFGGVAGGVAEYVGASPLVVRLIWLASLPLSGGLTGVVYLLLWLMLPLEPLPAGTAGS